LGETTGAEDSHADDYDNSRLQSYCLLVIDPKVKKRLNGQQREIKAGYQHQGITEMQAGTPPGSRPAQAVGRIARSALTRPVF
jgi:hypothetical protein